MFSLIYICSEKKRRKNTIKPKQNADNLPNRNQNMPKNMAETRLNRDLVCRLEKKRENVVKTQRREDGTRWYNMQRTMLRRNFKPTNYKKCRRKPRQAKPPNRRNNNKSDIDLDIEGAAPHFWRSLHPELQYE